MQAEVTVLTRRGEGLFPVSHTVTGQQLRFGRGTENEIPLADIRVELAAAVLSQSAEGLFIEKHGDTPLRVNGRSTGAARVGPGDEILIGPYKVVLSEPPEGLDVALSVELVQPLGDALQPLMTGSRLRLDQTHLSKRRASWTTFLLLTVLCLAIPISIYLRGSGVKRSASVPAEGGSAFLGIAWSPGEMSNQHRYFAQHCVTCHENAFSPVKDSACLTCHAAIGSHIEAATLRDLEPVHRDLQRTRCADCHEEHRGLRSLVIREGALCVQCHRSLAETAPRAGISDVRGFPDGHPQFRVTLVGDAANKSFERVELRSDLKPADHPNLIFSHAAHLDRDKFKALGKEPMVCTNCHAPEPSGQGFLAITYKGQCQSCHALKFDTEMPWDEVPHGDDARVQAEIEGFYASLSLKRDFSAPSIPPPGIERRLPGSAPSPSEQPGRRAWIRGQTAQALGIIFDEKRGCFECHIPDRRRGPFTVAPVMLLTRFLSPARFDHTKHAPVPCEDCHNAQRSQASSDVLVPGIDRCVTCHGSETASFRAQSTCSSCHVFHRHEFGQMRQAMVGEKQ
jgi:predicted CXXCH cytochrome family protein